MNADMQILEERVALWAVTAANQGVRLTGAGGCLSSRFSAGFGLEPSEDERYQLQMEPGKNEQRKVEELGQTVQKDWPF